MIGCSPSNRCMLSAAPVTCPLEAGAHSRTFQTAPGKPRRLQSPQDLASKGTQSPYDTCMLFHVWSPLAFPYCAWGLNDWPQVPHRVGGAGSSLHFLLQGHVLLAPYGLSAPSCVQRPPRYPPQASQILSWLKWTVRAGGGKLTQNYGDTAPSSGCLLQ